ncbi:glycosyltransferase, partial [Patescibacteria group bacterium]|nr:glycosyltransferase [Patescibacteria group bacterium]
MAGSRKKICYFIDTLSPHSGWGRLADEVINRVEKTGGYEVVILTRVSSGDPRERAVLASGLWGMARSVVRARALMRDCDIAHAFDGWPNSVIAYAACLFSKKSLYITAIGTYSVLPLDFLVQGFLLRRAYRAAKKIFAISNYTRKKILERVYLQNMETVNLGVDFKKFHRAYHDPAKKKNIILSVGEIKARKGYRVAVEAVLRL